MIHPPIKTKPDNTMKPNQETSEALKFDQEKPPMELLSRAALEGTAKVLAHGAKKYTKDGVPGTDNWRKGMPWRKLIGSLVRHAMEFQDGQDIDPESGLPIIDHVICCAMFLSEYQKRNLGTDNRWKPTKTDSPSPQKATVSESLSSTSTPQPVYECVTVGHFSSLNKTDAF